MLFKVRELAAATISGLVRCKFIQSVDHLQVCSYIHYYRVLVSIYEHILLQKIFANLSISKIRKRDKSMDNPDAPEEQSTCDFYIVVNFYENTVLLSLSRTAS